ncbi:Ser/Thr protein phosphatase [Histomonas meleagridis]|uniref:Ser/Thr protein phosphatase n=1 Tax=Histomonas meleagridis TaxID=135588 RepID=UPI003559F34D|nr:Ser/Thr protein phosphatase [Histomonas meleagridis]KAH0803122.1 Ser/Thr protein phosphatase [Histomonas meleagridis]
MGVFASIRQNISRIISLFLPPIIVVISYFYYDTRRVPEIFKEIPVDDNTIFDHNTDPIWIAHLTDLHVSPIHPNSCKRLGNSLEHIKNVVKPIYTVITGDITDNLDEEDVFSAGYPHEDHWILYKKIRDASGMNGSDLIEILGNHDTWARASFQPKYYQYLLNPIGMFYAKSYIKGGLRVVAFSPIDFPSGHSAWHYILPMKPKMLDELEIELDNDKSAMYTIVAVHFSTEMMYPLDNVRSTISNRTFAEILSDKSYNIVTLLNGHSHPHHDFESRHYGKTIEITGTSLMTMDGYGILSIDNGRVNYKKHYSNETDVAILTFPTPDEIAATTMAFESFQIRVVSFSEKLKNFHVSGDVTGDLVFNRKVGRNGYLYTMNTYLEKGKHSITISGDLNETCNFSIGVTGGPVVHERTIDYNVHSVVFFFWFSIIYQILVIASMFIPQKISNKFENTFQRHTILRILLAPVYIGTLLRKSLVSILLIIWLILSVFATPISFTQIEGQNGFISIYGVHLGKSFSYDIVSQHMGLIVMFLSVTTFECLFAMLEYQVSFGMIFDIAFGVLVANVSTHLLAMKYLFDKAISPWFGISVQFHVIPLLYQIIFVFRFVAKILSRKKHEKTH